MNNKMKKQEINKQPLMRDLDEGTIINFLKKTKDGHYTKVDPFKIKVNPRVSELGVQVYSEEDEDYLYSVS